MDVKMQSNLSPNSWQLRLFVTTSIFKFEAFHIPYLWDEDERLLLLTINFVAG